MTNQKVEDLLGISRQDAKREREIVLKTLERIHEGVVIPETQEDTDEKKFEEFKQLVDKAVAATKGIKKVIEQTQDLPDVPADQPTKDAIKRVFGIDSDVVTFEQYKQAIALRDKEMFAPMRKAMSDAQFG